MSNVITNRSIFLIIKDAQDTLESINAQTKRSSTFIRFVPRPEERYLIESKVGDFRACLGLLDWNVYTGTEAELEHDFPDATAEEKILIPTSLLNFPHIRDIFELVAEKVFGATPTSYDWEDIVVELSESMGADNFLLARTTYTVRDLLYSLIDCEYRPDVLTEDKLASLEATNRGLLDTIID
jgi:hypothetical protein